MFRPSMRTTLILLSLLMVLVTPLGASEHSGTKWNFLPNMKWALLTG